MALRVSPSPEPVDCCLLQRLGHLLRSSRVDHGAVSRAQLHILPSYLCFPAVHHSQLGHCISYVHLDAGASAMPLRNSGPAIDAHAAHEQIPIFRSASASSCPCETIRCIQFSSTTCFIRSFHGTQLELLALLLDGRQLTWRCCSFPKVSFIVENFLEGYNKRLMEILKYFRLCEEKYGRELVLPLLQQNITASAVEPQPEVRVKEESEEEGIVRSYETKSRVITGEYDPEHKHEVHDTYADYYEEYDESEYRRQEEDAQSPSAVPITEPFP